jgi:[acyl-carrier-protein] S-malonyltransferase
MLDSFKGHAAVRETLQEASDVLGQDMAQLIAAGPAETLNLTANTQPAMLVAAFAVYRVWLSEGGPLPTLVAGHSLGEYTALVAANVIAFKDALPLVRFRAQAMQEAVPVGQGGMAAIIGLDDDTVHAICTEAAHQMKDVVEAVNFNAPAQIVIAGSKAAVIKACEIARSQGAKRTLLLPVSAPFHSSLLKPASDRLREYLAGMPLQQPAILVINNVDVAMPSDQSAIKDALVRQAAAPVRWVESVRKMAAQGVTHLFECGPGKVLAGLTKRIDGRLTSGGIADRESLSAVLAALK